MSNPTLSRAENNGIFIAQNLKPIDYRVYAIEDTNGNLAYEPGVDKIGFLDGVFNPSDLPDFMAWYDTTRRYMTAEPQLFIRMFTDRQFKRQNLAEQKRPLQHKIELYFNAPYPQIDSLVLDGIDSSRIITEYVTPGRIPSTCGSTFRGRSCPIPLPDELPTSSTTASISSYRIPTS